MSREADKRKNSVQSIRKESSQLTKSDIKREINKVGKKVFVISSIVPAILTIFYLIFIFPDEISDPYFDYFYSYNLYGILISWSVVIFALTIPAMIGKKLLFAEDKKLILKLIPAITFVICVILGVIVYLIFHFSDGSYILEVLIVFSVPILLLTVISAIIARRLYDKHISESETYEKGVTDKNI